jgi:hypothetical protein
MSGPNSRRSTSSVIVSEMLATTGQTMLWTRVYIIIIIIIIIIIHNLQFKNRQQLRLYSTEWGILLNNEMKMTMQKPVTVWLQPVRHLPVDRSKLQSHSQNMETLGRNLKVCLNRSATEVRWDSQWLLQHVRIIITLRSYWLVTFSSSVGQFDTVNVTTRCWPQRQAKQHLNYSKAGVLYWTDRTQISAAVTHIWIS